MSKVLAAFTALFCDFSFRFSIAPYRLKPVRLRNPRGKAKQMGKRKVPTFLVPEKLKISTTGVVKSWKILIQ